MLPQSAGLTYMDMPLLQATIESIQRGQERFWQMLRREMQQFDEVGGLFVCMRLCLYVCMFLEGQIERHKNPKTTVICESMHMPHKLQAHTKQQLNNDTQIKNKQKQTITNTHQVLEGYRRNLYALRRLMLCGSPEQRQRAVHLYIQQWADERVGRLIDPAAKPSDWLSETLTPAQAAALLDGGGGAAGAAAAAAASGAGAAGAAAAGGEDSGGPRVSPLAALMAAVNRLVNPPELVGKMTVR